jgi:hypothetical protein
MAYRQLDLVLVIHSDDRSECDMGGGDSRTGASNVSINSPPCRSLKSARFTPGLGFEREVKI